MAAEESESEDPLLRRKMRDSVQVAICGVIEGARTQ